MGEENSVDVDLCVCSELGNFAVVRMGDPEGLDERLLKFIQPVKMHGGRQWWLYAGKCTSCGSLWMIAEESRVHDNHYVVPLSESELSSIAEKDRWPNQFQSWEAVIGLGPKTGQVCRFADPNDLIGTVKELIEDRSEITENEIGYLLCVSDTQARKLMDTALSSSWAELRPWA